MEMYKKPVMDIIDLERIDVLTCSANSCSYPLVTDHSDSTTNGGKYGDGCDVGCVNHNAQ
jgi:hypothetical protein